MYCVAGNFTGKVTAHLDDLLLVAVSLNIFP